MTKLHCISSQRLLDGREIVQDCLQFQVVQHDLLPRVREDTPDHLEEEGRMLGRFRIPLVLVKTVLEQKRIVTNHKNIHFSIRAYLEF